MRYAKSAKEKWTGKPCKLKYQRTQKAKKNTNRGCHIGDKITVSEQAKMGVPLFPLCDEPQSTSNQLNNCS